MGSSAKSFGLILILIMAISSLSLIDFIPVGLAQSGTNFSGTITTDTTWTSANSPYNFTGDVLVNNGVTLTIEPGVFVNQSNYELTINGTLQAIGGSQNSIVFNGDNSAEIVFSSFAEDWSQSTGTGCIIENALIGPYMVVYNSPEINNDTVYGRIVTNANASISNCIIYGGLDIVGGQGTVSNNTVISPSETGLQGQGIIISGAVNATVSDNTITTCSEGITIDTENGLGVGNFTSLIEGNLIAGNTYGIKIVAFSGGTILTPLIQNNTITSNIYGIYFASFPSGELTPTTIIENNISDNSNYNVLSNVTNDHSAANNWWGTTDSQAINHTIYDFKNDSNWGNFSFVPFLASPNTQAPTFVNASAGDGGYTVPRGYVSVNYGGSQTFTIIPNYGYYIVSVLVNGTSVGAVNSYNVRNIDGATTISATFAPNPTRTPTPSPTLTPVPTAVPTIVSTSAPTSVAPSLSPASTASTSPTISSTPTVPEFPILIIVPLFAAIILLSIVFIRKRHLR
jgi:hypothetical protein